MKPFTRDKPTLKPSLKSALPSALLAVLLAGALTACGDDAQSQTADEAGQTAADSADSVEAASSLTVEDPWVRATSGTQDTSMTAAFMVLDNTGAEEITITGASAAVAGRAELHEMASVDGQMVMRQVEGGLSIAPGRGQLLQPGGHHVMLMELTGELAPGDEVELTLELSDGSEVVVGAPVKEFTEEAGHYHGEDDGHSHSHDEEDGHGHDGDGEHS